MPHYSLNRMNANFVVITIGIIAVVSLFCTTTNYASALQTTCYIGGKGSKNAICIHTLDEYNPPKKAIT